MWRSHDSVKIRWSGKFPYSKIAAFDLDGTLVASKTGKQFNLAADDWIFFPTVFPRLHELHDFGIVILSNQSRFTNETQARIEQIASQLPGNSLVLVATGNDQYRKPETGMIRLLYSLVGELPMFYVGDAVGSMDPYPPYRWADTDRRLAENVQIPFYRPIDVFPVNQPPLPESGIIVLMGNPGSGKSTTAERFRMAGWTVCAKDDLTPAQMKKCYQAGRRDGKVVLDATHASQKSRLEWQPTEIWWHIRDGRPFNALRDHPVPPVAYGVYSKYFEDPRLDGIPVVIIG